MQLQGKMINKSGSINIIGCILFVSCMHSRLNNKINQISANDIADAKSTVNASAFTSCNSKSILEIPTTVRKALFVWQNKKPNLAYEGVFREAIRTIWQPLSPSLQLQGDGIIIGKRDNPFTVDFTTITDMLGDFWTSYRYKLPQSESFAATVEYLPNSQKNSSLISVQVLPEPNTSVQRIWIIPQIKSENGISKIDRGIVNLVLKLASTTQISDEASGEMFVWYNYNVKNKILKKMDVINTTNSGLSPVSFFASANFAEPVAVGVFRNNYDEYSFNKKAVKYKDQIVASKFFSKNPSTSVIFESEKGIHSLAAWSADMSTARVYIAWMSQAKNKTTPDILITPISLQNMLDQPKLPIEQEKKKGKSNKKNDIKRNNSNINSITVSYINTEYVPSQLNFMQFPPLSGGALTWWGGTDIIQSLLIMPLINIQPNATNKQFKIFAFANTEVSGTPLGFTTGIKNTDSLLLAYAMPDTTKNTQHIATKINICAVPEKKLMEITK